MSENEKSFFNFVTENVPPATSEVENIHHLAGRVMRLTHALNSKLILESASAALRASNAVEERLQQEKHIVARSRDGHRIEYHELSEFRFLCLAEMAKHDTYTQALNRRSKAEDQLLQAKNALMSLIREINNTDHDK